MGVAGGGGRSRYRPRLDYRHNEQQYLSLVAGTYGSVCLVWLAVLLGGRYRLSGALPPLWSSCVYWRAVRFQG